MIRWQLRKRRSLINRRSNILNCSFRALIIINLILLLRKRSVLVLFWKWGFICWKLRNSPLVLHSLNNLIILLRWLPEATTVVWSYDRAVDCVVSVIDIMQSNQDSFVDHTWGIAIPNRIEVVISLAKLRMLPPSWDSILSWIGTQIHEWIIVIHILHMSIHILDIDVRLNNLDEISYSELVKLKSQLNRD